MEGCTAIPINLPKEKKPTFTKFIIYVKSLATGRQVDKRTITSIEDLRATMDLFKKLYTKDEVEFIRVY